MSEHNSISKALSASELWVTPNTETYADTVCARVMRIHCTSGDATANVAYVASNWQTQSPGDEHTLDDMTSGDIQVRQIQVAGTHRAEIGNESAASAAGAVVIFDAQTNRTKKPIIQRGMIKRIMNGVTRRSA